MKVLIRGCGLALLMVSCLALAGCSSSNESEADKLQKNLGAAPTPVAKGGDATPPPTSDAKRGLPSSSATEYGQTKGAKTSAPKK